MVCFEWFFLWHFHTHVPSQWRRIDWQLAALELTNTNMHYQIWLLLISFGDKVEIREALDLLKEICSSVLAKLSTRADVGM